MNIKSTLKTMAVALPLAVAPLKTNAQTVAKQAEKIGTEKAFSLKANVGGGYGQLPVLYSKPTAYGTGGIRCDVKLGKNGTFYQGVQVSAGKDAVIGRYDAGYASKTAGGTEWNVGVYGSNDFKSKEFVMLKDPMNKKTVNCPTHSGLLQAGLTAGVKQPVSKNVSLYAKGDLANLSYSSTGECVYPFKTRSFSEINPAENYYVLKDGYNYEKGVGSAIGASIEGGVEAQIVKNLKLKGSAGYNTWNDANFGVTGTYDINIVK